MHAHQGAIGVDAQAFHEGLEDAVIKLAGAGPFRHLGDRLRRVPAALVWPIRGDGVVHVAQGAHAGRLAERVAHQRVRVALAIRALVVVQAHVKRQRPHTRAVAQQLVAAQGVALDHLVFGLGELAGLVQHFERHHGLADVVQQAGQAGFTGLFFAVSELACQRHHQGADRHRMHVGIIVVCLEPGQAHQGTGIAPHRVRNVRHQWQATLCVHRMPHAGFAEQGLNGLPGLLEQRGRAPQLLFHRGGLAQRCGRAGKRFGRSGHANHWRRHGHGMRRRLRHVQPLGRVDPALRHAAGLQLGQVIGGAQQEPGLPERVVEPGAAQLMQMHAQARIGYLDFLEHGRPGVELRMASYRPRHRPLEPGRPARGHKKAAGSQRLVAACSGADSAGLQRKRDCDTVFNSLGSDAM